MTKPPLAQPGQIVDAWATWKDSESKAAVLRTEHVEILRLHIEAGVRIPTYEAQGEIIIFCLQGRVLVSAMGQQRELNGGQLLYLLIHEPFELDGLEEASLFITILRPHDAQPLIGDDPRQR